ncbi:MAG: hypothetical protein WEF50_13040 [Myxococcota bacterium]
MRKALSLLLAIAPLAGCFSVTHAYSGDKLLTTDPTPPGRGVRLVRHFEAHDRQFYWLHGGFPVGEPLNAAALAAREAGDHDAVVNLEIHDGQNFTDLLISHVPCVLTLICGSWSAWAEGDVVDYVPAEVSK